MLKHNKKITLEELNDDSYYTIVDDKVILVNGAAYQIYASCDNCYFEDIVMDYVNKNGTNNIIDPSADVEDILKQLLDLQLIVEEE